MKRLAEIALVIGILAGGTYAAVADQPEPGLSLQEVSPASPGRDNADSLLRSRARKEVSRRRWSETWLWPAITLRAALSSVAPVLTSTNAPCFGARLETKKHRLSTISRPEDVVLGRIRISDRYESALRPSLEPRARTHPAPLRPQTSSLASLGASDPEPRKHYWKGH